jgi:hypothetical protein
MAVAVGLLLRIDFETRLAVGKEGSAEEQTQSDPEQLEEQHG